MGKGLLVLVCTLVLPVGSAYALRCGSELVSEKDVKIEVVRKCGDPVSVEAWTAYEVLHRSSRHRQHPTVQDEIVVPIAVEEWTYNFGPHRLMHVLRFENGYLVKIRTLGYGY